MENRWIEKLNNSGKLDMRGAFELNRILSIANFVLIAILGYMFLNLILAKEVRQDRAINSKSKSTQADIDDSQNLSYVKNHEIILERNIFNPARFDAFQKDSQKETLAAQAPRPVARKQLELRLLGTVAGNEEVACAVVEDIKTRVQDLYKTGDVVQGSRIEKIERNRIVLLNEGAQKILNLYVASEDSVALAKGTEASETEEVEVTDVIKVTSPTEREVNKSAFLAKIGGIEAVLKTVEVSPYSVSGKAEGLRITGLEGLSMAKFVGLENGDVIQTINGQIVTDNRKAFQVLRKARALSSLDMQLMRDTEKKTLSFQIE